MNNSQNMRVRLVVATRKALGEFFTETSLGRSLQAHREDARIELRVFERNVAPLPIAYNIAIEEATASPAYLVFVHDDVALADFDWVDKVREALGTFHIIGLAGNRRRLPGQPNWALIDSNRTWDNFENLSGCVGHGRDYATNISRYGPWRLQCKLLDGLFLAVPSGTLIESGLYFDPQFPFHFYDMDFCRQAELRGLRMGTWPIQVVHSSGGSTRSAEWRRCYALYLSKYGESTTNRLETAATSAGSDR